MISSPLGKQEVRMTFGRALQERSLSTPLHNASPNLGPEMKGFKCGNYP